MTGERSGGGSSARRAAARWGAPIGALLRRLGASQADGRRAEGTWRDEAIRALVQGEDESGEIEQDEMEMIAGIMDLAETKVREVMVPRIDIVAIPVDATLDEALDTIIAAGHSRIPVYEDSIDNIVGLLYAKDLLRPFRERDFCPDLTRLLRQPYFVPQTKSVDVLLGELQNRKVHIAIVVDEYGGTAGLVTIEDLLEEIVGEIQDEYDREEPRVEPLSDDEIVFSGGFDVDDVNRMMGVDLPTADADTLAGLVFARLGKVPEPGERITFADAEIVVLELDGRRIHRVRVSRQRAEPPTSASGTPGETIVPPDAPS